MKAPQLQLDKVLHGFVTRLASSRARCSDTDRTCSVSPGAKQLPCFLSSSAGNRDATCSFPSLELMHRASKFAPLLQQTPVTSKSSPAHNLKRPIRFNKMDIKDAPSKILGNFCTSFQSLIDERLRQASLSLIQASIAQSRKTEMDDSTAKAHAHAIKKLFPSSTKPPIYVTAAVSNWVTLLKKDSETPSTRGKPSLVQPIIFELVIDVSILGSGKTTIRLSVPGTISAVFSRLTFRLETVRIDLVTDALLESMKLQCNAIVQKAIELAYKESFVHDAASAEREKNEEVVDVDRQMMPPPPPRPPRQTSSNKRQIEVDVSERRTKMRRTNFLVTPAA